jgi:hypothetical protein
VATQRDKYRSILVNIVGDDLRLSLAMATTTWASPLQHMFGNLLGGISNNLNPLVLLGAAATCWSLWLSRLYTQLSIGSVLDPFSRSRICRVWLWRRHNNWNRWWSVYGLMVTRMCWATLFLLAVCLFKQRPESLFKILYHVDVKCLKFNKSFLYKKKFKARTKKPS